MRAMPFDKIYQNLKNSMAGKRDHPELVVTDDTPLAFTELVTAAQSIPLMHYYRDLVLRDPISARLSATVVDDLLHKAIETGETYAREARQYTRVEDAFAAWQVQYETAVMPPMPDRVVYAEFTEPNHVMLYTDAFTKYKELFKTAGLPAPLSPAQAKQVVLAHELFHFFEYRDRHTIITRNYKTTTFDFKVVKLRATPVFLSEVAAMAFAQQFCELPYPSNIFDILLVYAYNPIGSTKIFRRIQALRNDDSRQLEGGMSYH